MTVQLAAVVPSVIAVVKSSRAEGSFRCRPPERGEDLPRSPPVAGKPSRAGRPHEAVAGSPIPLKGAGVRVAPPPLLCAMAVILKSAVDIVTA